MVTDINRITSAILISNKKTIRWCPFSPCITQRGAFSGVCYISPIPWSFLGHTFGARNLISNPLKVFAERMLPTGYMQGKKWTSRHKPYKKTIISNYIKSTENCSSTAENMKINLEIFMKELSISISIISHWNLLFPGKLLLLLLSSKDDNWISKWRAIFRSRTRERESQHFNPEW